MSQVSALFLPSAPGIPEQLETREEAEALIRALAGASEALAARPALELARELGRVGLRFRDPKDPVHREAVERVAGETGLSTPMAREIVTGMARDWTPERLERMVRADFPDPLVLDGFRPAEFGGRLRAVGGRLAFHIGAGSVPGVSVTSMIRSLLVKCPVLLKPGAGDAVLAPLFAGALAASDPELAGGVAVCYWPRGSGGPLEALALRASDPRRRVRQPGADPSPPGPAPARDAARGVSSPLLGRGGRARVRGDGAGGRVRPPGGGPGRRDLRSAGMRLPADHLGRGRGEPSRPPRGPSGSSRRSNSWRQRSRPQGRASRRPPRGGRRGGGGS